MKSSLLAGLALLATGGAFAGEPLFATYTSQEGLDIPYTVCASGKAAMSCYRFHGQGKDIFVLSKSKKPTFPEAGIHLEIPGYKVNGCVPYTNGYCIFAVNNTAYTKLVLTAQ